MGFLGLEGEAFEGGDHPPPQWRGSSKGVFEGGVGNVGWRGKGVR